MLQTSIPVILFVVLSCLPSGTAQVSHDWQQRYGPPVAESYLIRDKIVMTVFYSLEGKTCKARIEPSKPQSRSIFEGLMKEIIPVSERGKKIRSIGLGGIGGGIEATLYERVNISLATTAQGPTGNIESTTITWIGIQCKYPEQEKQK